MQSAPVTDGSMAHKYFVGGVHPQTMDTELSQAFEPYGLVCVPVPASLKSCEWKWSVPPSASAYLPRKFAMRLLQLIACAYPC